MPDGQVLDHPVLLISCSNANSREDYFTAVMMTASTQTDKFSFKLRDDMFEAKLEKEGCQLRLYIILAIRGENIKKLANRMNKPDFKAVIQQIKDYVLVVD
jgi:nicotinamide mononucleotide adenylyltransferase